MLSSIFVCQSNICYHSQMTLFQFYGYSNKITRLLTLLRTQKSGYQRISVRVIEWPSRPPDLNTKEHSWSVPVRNVYANNRQFLNTTMLPRCIIPCWGRIEKSMINGLVKSMLNHCVDVVATDKCVTRYWDATTVLLVDGEWHCVVAANVDYRSLLSRDMLSADSSHKIKNMSWKSVFD